MKRLIFLIVVLSLLSCNVSIESRPDYNGLCEIQIINDENVVTQTFKEADIYSYGREYTLIQFHYEGKFYTYPSSKVVIIRNEEE